MTVLGSVNQLVQPIGIIATATLVVWQEYAGVTEVMQVTFEPVIYCCSIAPMGGLQLPPHIPGVYESTIPTSELAGLPS